MLAGPFRGCFPFLFNNNYKILFLHNLNRTSRRQIHIRYDSPYVATRWIQFSDIATSNISTRQTFDANTRESARIVSELIPDPNAANAQHTHGRLSSESTMTQAALESGHLANLSRVCLASLSRNMVMHNNKTMNLGGRRAVMKSNATRRIRIARNCVTTRWNDVYRLYWI